VSGIDNRIGILTLFCSSQRGYDEPDYDTNNPIVRGGQSVVETKYLTDAITREAVDIIDRYDNKPFFLSQPITQFIARSRERKLT
jgi:hypothetical protein